MNSPNRCYNCMSITADATSACPSCGWTQENEPDSTLYLPMGYLLNNRYLIGKVIGVGGFGIVYVAWDSNLDVRVAVKEFLAKDYAARSTDHISLTVYSGGAREEHNLGIEKFIEEAKALAKFQDHPGIVKVNESFRANNTAYMVMQYLDGMTLKEYLKEQPGEKMPFNTAVKAMIPIMDALREVHSAGFVHRDISPDNIFITRQKQIKLLDFGSARYAIGEHSKSLTSVLKHGYAPVEQYSSKGNQGPWSDVYAVAATLYRCITGQPPTDAMDRMQEDTLKSPTQLGVDIPPAGESAIMRGLALKSNVRFKDIPLFQQALTSEETTTPVQGAVIEPYRQQPQNIIECPECGAKNQLNPGEDPKTLRCGKCKWELGVSVASANNAECGPIVNLPVNQDFIGKIAFKSISHTYFIIAIIGGVLLFVLAALLEEGTEYFNANANLSAICFLVSFALWLFAFIYHFIALHRCWAILQGSTARTTPGRAVGRLFIPFYNLYWYFVAYKGLAEDANTFAEMYGLKKRISIGLSLAVSICCVVPYINIAIVPLLFTFIIYQWSQFYNEVSANWNRLNVRRDDSIEVSGSNTAVIVCVILVSGIAVIGILAAIAIPQFSAYKTKGYNSAAIADLKNIKTAAESYFADHQSYPQSISSLNISNSNGVARNYEPECRKDYDYSARKTVIICQKYSISTTHSNGDKIFNTTSDEGIIYFRLKLEPGKQFIPME